MEDNKSSCTHAHSSHILTELDAQAAHYETAERSCMTEIDPWIGGLKLDLQRQEGTQGQTMLCSLH